LLFTCSLVCCFQKAAQDLVNFFTPFNIPQVNTHIHDFDRLKQKLVDKIKREIPAGLSDLEREILETETARLHGACECATIFGDDVRFVYRVFFFILSSD
jgi:hypothetical protein